jgi:hypothetical protein
MSFASIKFSIIAIIMMALTGCFSVELTAPDSVEQNSILTMTATPIDNEGEVSYQWTINNSVISEDATHHVMLPTLGEYTLTVVAIDAKGNEDTQTKTVSVIAQPSLNSDFSFAINVSDKTGFAITEAPVTINGTTVITDQYGLAQFDGISQTSLMLVSASKEGYLTQAYQYNFDAAQESATATLTLQNINPISHTVDSSSAIDITETELHTKLILEPNSFVDANGNPVTGDVEVTITPVDVRAVDNAFLGGAQALTTTGTPVALISTGMADYQFSQNGAAVSLAKGATAIIEMDLVVTTGDDGRVFAEGDSIEMWWFDTTTGFWIEDGVGSVELSDTSETGLKLVATVDHFTTWNWDYYFGDESATLTFKCLKDGQPLASDENCQITVASATINREYNASTAGVTAINTAPNVTYSVIGNMTSGSSLWTGSTAFTSVAGSNEVNVDLAFTPTKTGYVQCRVINDAITNIVPCFTAVSSDSIGDQFLDASEFINYRAPFSYVQGDVLTLSSFVGEDYNRSTLIETAGVNGTLDIEVVFDIQVGSLQCSVVLDGSIAEYFPCEALITADDGSSVAIFPEYFSGTPLKAEFPYSKDTSGLTIEVASVFNGAELRERGDNVGGYFMSGEPTELYLNLMTEAPVANVIYEIQSENIYSVKCVKGADYRDERYPGVPVEAPIVGEEVDCEISIYTSFERPIFQGNINELTFPDILPVWMNGKLYLENTTDIIGYAYNRIGHAAGNASYDLEIDAVNKVIIFTLNEELM